MSVAQSDNHDLRLITIAEEGLIFHESPQSVYEDDFHEYAYKNGFWWFHGSKPNRNEIKELRNKFAKYYINLYGYNSNIKYN